jgi:hypothetical protein
MKKILIVIIVLLVAYFAWRFIIIGAPIVFMTKAGEKPITAIVKEVRANKEIILEINSDSNTYKIDQITLPRELASRLKISPPVGFREELLSVSKDEESNKEAVDFVAKFNSETLRWIGNFQIQPNSKSFIVLPVNNTTTMEGKIYFKYSVKHIIGGTISTFNVNLSDKSKL